MYNCMQLEKYSAGSTMLLNCNCELVFFCGGGGHNCTLHQHCMDTSVVHGLQKLTYHCLFVMLFGYRTWRMTQQVHRVHWCMDS